MIMNPVTMLPNFLKFWIKSKRTKDRLVRRVNYLENLYLQILSEFDVARKTLTFMGGMSKFSKRIRKD